MAITVTSQTIVDGPKNIIVKVSMTGNETAPKDYTLVDASSFTGGGVTSTSLAIMRVQYSIGPFSASLLFHATENVEAFVLPDSRYSDIDFSDVGGIPNNAGAGKTGDIVLSLEARLSGKASFVFHLRKN